MYDIVVIGGGHAGIEAANGASKLGSSVLLITGNIDYIGEMPCNPAIGGVAKGNIVREVDALGGLMAKLTDRAGIQFRMLNRSKGVAVWGPRAQTDRYLYRQYAREEIENNPNIDILQDMVVDLIVEDKKVKGVITETFRSIEAKAVIVTAGTFLNGLAHIGESKVVCGRRGEMASTGLSEAIQKLGIKTGRLKTGTPARIDKESIDYSKLEEQEGDSVALPFSFTHNNDTKLVNKAVCWTLKTNLTTHDTIRANLDKSPLYGLNSVDGVGPRYCPSIEDKVVRFGDRNGHLLFLEPEGLNRREMYLNGFSTSLPVDVQEKMIKTLPGFENAKIIKPAYAIEYDYFEPRQLNRQLESRVIENLYFAGQVNGTSGYEEAAGQGLVAGVNADRKNRGLDPLVLGREEAYLGVLIDDLITKGTKEPYRMFTSRAEYRLLLRQDNCDTRLMPKAHKMSLISDETYENRKLVWKKVEEIKSLIRGSVISQKTWSDKGYGELKEGTRADQILKRPKITLEDILVLTDIDLSMYDTEIKGVAEADIVYEGFVKKQQGQIDKMKRFENMSIPDWVDYDKIEGLLIESREKLKSIKPFTVGQASRISGVNPSDISVLLVYLAYRKSNTTEEYSDE